MNYYNSTQYYNTETVFLNIPLPAVLSLYVEAIMSLTVWLSGNTLASVNVVALRQTRLVLGWVTVCGRVNHLGM